MDIFAGFFSDGQHMRYEIDVLRCSNHFTERKAFGNCECPDRQVAEINQQLAAALFLRYKDGGIPGGKVIALLNFTRTAYLNNFGRWIECYLQGHFGVPSFKRGN